MWVCLATTTAVGIGAHLYGQAGGVALVERRADHFADRAAITDAVVRLERRYLQGERTALTDSLAHRDLIKLLARSLDPHDGHLAANGVYAFVSIAQRLPTREELFARASRMLYAYRCVDTTRDATANVMLALACVKSDQGDAAAALMYADSIDTDSADRPLPCLLGNVHALRGHAQYALRRYADARESFAEAARILDADCTVEAGQYRAHVMAATCAVEVGDADAAYAYAERAIELVDAFPGGATGIYEGYMAYGARALALAAQGRAELAVGAAERSLAIARARRDPLHVTNARVTLGRVYELLGDPAAVIAAVGDLRAASAAEIDVAAQQRVLRLLSRAYEELGSLESAIAASNGLRRLDDSLRASSEVTRIRELRDRHAIDAMRYELAEARAEGARREAAAQLRLLCALGGLIALAALGSFMFYRLRVRRRESARLERLVAERTAELQAQTDLLAAHSRDLERTNAELERFAYVASHDMKTPIRNVTSFLNLLRRRIAPVPGSEVDDYLGHAHQYALQLHALVSDIETFMRHDALIDGTCGEFALRETLVAAADAVRERHPRGRVEVACAPELRVTLPGAYLRRVAELLIDNGLRYNTSPRPLVRVAVERPGGTGPLRLSFADNGIGIEPEYHGRVFELFRRLHTLDEYAGTGMGLALCRKLLAQFGGEVALQSVPGAGSTFTVCVPLVHEATARDVEGAAEGPVAVQSSPTP